MKKLIAILVVFAFIAGTAFAQTADGISVNAWGRGVFAPLVVVTAPVDINGDKAQEWEGKMIDVPDPKAPYYIDNDPDSPTFGTVVQATKEEPDLADPDGKWVDAKDKVYAGSGITWGGPKPRIDFRVNGNSDYVGFTAHLNAEDPGVGDTKNLWVKPLQNDYLKLTVGAFVEDTLRGKIAYDSGFENFVLVNLYEDAGVGAGPLGEDGIFSRFGTGGNNCGNAGYGTGFLLSSQPIDGLFIGLMVNSELWNWGGPGSGSGEAADIYRYMQLGFGYQIEGIGHLRAQYVGGWSGTIDPESDDVKYSDQDFKKLGRIELAFALTAVDNLLIDLGLKLGLPITFKDAQTINPGVNIALGATYGMDAFSILARIDMALGGSTKPKDGDPDEDGLLLSFGLIPEFAFDFGSLGLSIGGTIKAADKKAGEEDKYSPYSILGFGGYFKKGLGSGNFKVGLAYTLPPTVTTVDKDGNDKTGSVGSGVFSIPIILEYAFF
jgi:hypothetical protein